jgi:transcriptional regulator with XRE-family HTH domain
LLSESSVLQALSARIKYYRAVKDWSQETLSERAVINRTYLAAIERGRRNPSIRSIVKLANAFNVPFSVMFEPIPSSGADSLNRIKPKRGRRRSNKRP